MIALRRALFTIWQKRRGAVLKNFEQLNAEQWADEKRLVENQEKRLRLLLTHAFETVPYYQKLFNRLNISRIDFDNPIKVLEQLPILSKVQLRQHYKDLKSKDLTSRVWHEETSGGSTGEPARFVQDQQYTQWREAVKLIFDRWTGYRISSPRMAIWGSERDLMAARQSVKRRFFNWLKNKTAYNAYDMSEAKMGDCVTHLNKKKPDLILAYAESMFELAGFIEQNNLNIHSPNAIMTSAGILHPHMRERIENVFQTKIFNRYGSREVGDIACECNQSTGLHVSLPTHFVEIVKNDGLPAGPGESGEIIVTLLSNYAMPLIRYRIGDVGVWSETSCTCGRKWPLLKEVMGRVTDNFITKDGTLVYGAYFRHLLFYKEWVKKYQIVQEEADLIRFKVIPDRQVTGWEEMSKRDVGEIEIGVRRVMGEDCRTDIVLVDTIPPSPSGKYLYTFSKVNTKTDKTDIGNTFADDKVGSELIQ